MRSYEIPVAVPSMEWIRVLDWDTVETRVDGENERFHRGDRYSGHYGSGLASFGSIQGDWRMIREIADDIRSAFNILDKERRQRN